MQHRYILNRVVLISSSNVVLRFHIWKLFEILSMALWGVREPLAIVLLAGLLP